MPINGGGQPQDQLAGILGGLGKALQVARDVYGIDTWSAEDRLKKLKLEDEAGATDKDSDRSKNRSGTFKSILGEYVKHGVLSREQAAPYYERLEAGMSDRDVGTAMGDLEPLVGLKKSRDAAQNHNPLTKPPTADQNKAAGFARRLEQSDLDFGDLIAGGYDRADKKTARDAAMGEIPLIGPLYKATIQGANTKRQEQAEQNFLNAVLRRESGASISPTERSSGEQQYFPRSGDTDEVKAQKQRNREQVLASLKTEAGHAYGQTPLITRGNSQGGGGTDLKALADQERARRKAAKAAPNAR